MATANALANTYLDLLPNETLYHVLELANTPTIRKCIHCKWYTFSILCFYNSPDCDCGCLGTYIYLCAGCLAHKYKYVNETRKHVRTVAWRNRYRQRRYEKRVVETRSRTKSTTDVEFVDFVDLFS